MIKFEFEHVLLQFDSAWMHTDFYMFSKLLYMEWNKLNAKPNININD